ncbi:MAG: hypothetical protein WAO35_08490 [Terriglobia bacterium]
MSTVRCSRSSCGGLIIVAIAVPLRRACGAATHALAYTVYLTGIRFSSTEAIRELCKGRIAHFKIPRYVKFVDSFPTTINGKTQKYKMREISIKEMGLEEAALIATA